MTPGFTGAGRAQLAAQQASGIPHSSTTAAQAAALEAGRRAIAAWNAGLSPAPCAWPTCPIHGRRYR